MIATGVENASQKFRGIVYDRALKVNRWWYNGIYNAHLGNASRANTQPALAIHLTPSEPATAPSPLQLSLLLA